MTTVEPAAVERVTPEQFATLAAELWRRQGWTVSDTEFDDRLYELRRRDGDDEERRALVAVYRSPGAAVGTEPVRDCAEIEVGPDTTTLVTNAGFTPEAVDVAAAFGVDLVGPDDLARLVPALDARPLLEDASADDATRVDPNA